MSEYIEKETMRRIIKEQERIHGIRGAGWIELAMDREKPVDVDTIRHGRWLTDGIAEVCDQCGFHIVIEQYSEGDMNYCPNCGAKMDEKDGES